MTLDEIRKNKPDGATHYKLWKWGDVDYIKVHKENIYDAWYNKTWVPLPYAYFSYPLSIKPLY